jgi:hypothetical protein
MPTAGGDAEVRQSRLAGKAARLPGAPGNIQKKAA